jgi:hypothetical protein
MRTSCLDAAAMTALERNLAIVVLVAAVIVGAVAFFIGYKIGQMPPAPIVIQLQNTPK